MLRQTTHLLLDAGESIRAVSEYLGHSDPGFTLRTYTHLMPASADRTRAAVDAAFARGRSDDENANEGDGVSSSISIG